MKKKLAGGSHIESDRTSNNQSTETAYSSSTALSLKYVILFFIGTFAWYAYAGGGSAVKTLPYVSGQIVNSLNTESANPQVIQNATLAQVVLSPLHNLALYGQYIPQILILIGFSSYFVLNRGAIKCYREYAYLCITCLALWILSLIVPSFAPSGRDRIYHIVLLFLAPFFVIGCIESLKALKALSSARKRHTPVKEVAGSLQLVSILIVIFLLFNTGFIYEVLSDHPTSVWLDNSVDFPQYNSKEIRSANWLASVGDVIRLTDDQSSGGTVKLSYADFYRTQILSSVGLYGVNLPPSVNNLAVERYVYLGTYNVAHGKVLIQIQAYTSSDYVTNHLSRIYDNAGSQIYR